MHKALAIFAVASMSVLSGCDSSSGSSTSSSGTSTSSSALVGSWRLIDVVSGSYADTSNVTFTSSGTLSELEHYVEWTADTISLDEYDTMTGTWSASSGNLSVSYTSKYAYKFEGTLYSGTESGTRNALFSVSGSTLSIVDTETYSGTLYYDTSDYTKQ
jgi:hypothetical protein